MLLLPLSVSLRIGAVIGWTIGQFCRRERSVVEAQVRYLLRATSKNNYLLPDTPAHLAGPQLPKPEDISKFSSKVFTHVGKLSAEALNIPRLLERDPNSESGFKYITSTGQEVYNKIIRDKVGAISLSAHLGCWELLAAFHVASGVTVTAIGRVPNYVWLAEVIRKVREAYRTETVWRDESSAMRKLMGAIKQGRVLAALIDQDTSLGNVFSPFFGLSAASPEGPIRIGVKNRLTIISTFIVRTGPMQHHIISRKIDYDPDDPDAVTKITKTYNEHLEDLIVRYPKQWIWWHRRWRRRPGIDYERHPEQLPGTRQYIEWLDQAKPEVVS